MITNYEEMLQENSWYRLVPEGPCGCGGDFYYLEGHLICRGCGQTISLTRYRAMEHMPKLGLIEGRHEMPIDGYLLPADTSDLYGFHGGTYKAAFDAVQKYEFVLPWQGFVMLYATGLTSAVIGALDGFRWRKTDVVIMSYDRETNDYVPIWPQQRYEGVPFKEAEQATLEWHYRRPWRVLWNAIKTLCGFNPYM